MLTRGSIYMADLPKTTNSSVQGGLRPVVIIQNNAGNMYSPTVQIIPLTSQLKKPLPVHTVIRHSSLTKISIALAEQIQTIDKSSIRQYVGKLDDTTIERINTCIMIQLGLVHN